MQTASTLHNMRKPSVPEGGREPVYLVAQKPAHKQ